MIWLPNLFAWKKDGKQGDERYKIIIQPNSTYSFHLIKGILRWIRQHYSKVIGSIAFYPAIMAVCFLLLSWLILEMDYSPWGKHVKSQLSWLSLQDASTARVILSTVISGIMSLTVFSFSMVMIVLNQTASQLSNRILDSMIESRFQQVVLGFYIGTIVYALFILSTIRDTNNGIYVPALSIYLLIFLTVVDIFLFIYFLDYVTKTVKYETVIKRVQTQTLKTMKKLYRKTSGFFTAPQDQVVSEIYADVSGYFQGFDSAQLIQDAQKEKLLIAFQREKGAYVLRGACLMLVYANKAINDVQKQNLLMGVDFFNGQPIESNPDYGFRHLAEIAIKALSPGINDPATAVMCIHALGDLFAYRIDHALPLIIKDESDNIRIVIKEQPFNEMFQTCFYPIWEYGHKDSYIRKAMTDMLGQLIKLDTGFTHWQTLDGMFSKMNVVSVN
ncbi:DUF2254 domain-containing protein [Mucilaginibacter litoreus]|uniref:DUF2254 domain-containing protein n=1 Tax=Mucilaginibacter litoreus TaxID=1048221 RepID=A0ABW3AX08_9SPHI